MFQVVLILFWFKFDDMLEGKTWYFLVHLPMQPAFTKTQCAEGQGVSPPKRCDILG